ncbi:MAG: MFS transporter [Alphaproteobacteria bacterium]
MTTAHPGGPGMARAVATCFLPFAAGYLLSYVYRTVNAVVGPRIATELVIDLAALGVLTSAYFAGFVAMQIPAGIMLDRLGPRRVQAGLLLVAALGAALFALADGIGSLALARGIVGVGVATCLVGGFKANTLFWPAERLGTANGILMASAGIGGAVATLPVTWLADALGWRGVFWVLGAATVLLSAVVWVAVPDRRAGSTERLSDAFAGVRAVFSSPHFWRVVPLSAATQAAFQAYHTLWTAPWLVEVAGLPPSAVPGAMLAILLSIIPGYVLSGTLTDLAGRRGLDRSRFFAAYTAGFMALQLLLAFVPATGSTAVALWMAFVVLGTGSVIAYVILTPLFAKELGGRLNTAINLVVFLVAFAMQATIGHALLAAEAAFGTTRAGAHVVVLLAIVAIQAIAWAWFLRGMRAWPR